MVHLYIYIYFMEMEIGVLRVSLFLNSTNSCVVSGGTVHEVDIYLLHPSFSLLPEIVCI